MAYIGIDWADKKHDFCLQAAGAEQREFGTFDHTPEAIEQWAKLTFVRPISGSTSQINLINKFSLSRC
jgi:hypothetical protein